MPQLSQEEENELIERVQRVREAFDELWMNYEDDILAFVQSRHIPKKEIQPTLNAAQKAVWNEISSQDFSENDLCHCILDVVKRHDQRRRIAITHFGSPELSQLIKDANENEPGAMNRLVTEADPGESVNQNGRRVFGALVQDVQNGDTNAFKELVERASENAKRKAFDKVWQDYQTAFRDHLRRKSFTDEEQIEDVLVGVADDAWKKIATYNPDRSSFYNWVITCCAEYVKRQYIYIENRWYSRHVVPEPSDDSDNQDTNSMLEQMAYNGQAQANQDQNLELMWDALGALAAVDKPPHQKIVFLLNKLGYTPEEIYTDLSDIPLLELVIRAEEEYVGELAAADLDAMVACLVAECLEPLHDEMAKTVEDFYKLNDFESSDDFDIPPGFADDLDQANMSLELRGSLDSGMRQAYDDDDVSLPEYIHIHVKARRKRWLLEHDPHEKQYLIRTNPVGYIKGYELPEPSFFENRVGDITLNDHYPKKMGPETDEERKARHKAAIYRWTNRVKDAALVYLEVG